MTPASWIELIELVLRPSRPDLARCLRAREDHLAARRLVSEERGRAIASCVNRIEGLRSAAFAANDGVVTSRMTELEREWRALSRTDAEAGVMDLWARIAPPSWIDRKRWRGGGVDAAVALAADVEGVEAAEAAVSALRVALAPWWPIGARIEWRPFEHDAAFGCVLLGPPMQTAIASFGVGGADDADDDYETPAGLERVFQRARQGRAHVHEAALLRLPERPLLAQDLAFVAYVDCVWGAAALADRPDPVAAMIALWRTGYTLAAVDAAGVTLEIPTL